MLVFLNGKAIKYGHKVVRRPDLVEGFNTPSLLEAGFDVLLPKSVLEHTLVVPGGKNGNAG